MTNNAEDTMTLVLAGTVAALVVAAARGAQGSRIRGLLSNPVPRLGVARAQASATRLDQAA